MSKPSTGHNSAAHLTGVGETSVGGATDWWDDDPTSPFYVSQKWKGEQPGAEPADKTTSEWSTWRAHQIGCDTAWTVMYLDGNSPF